MTQEETLMILKALRGAYPQFYRGCTRQEAEDTVALWCDMFRGDDARLVGAAVKSVIASDRKGFPPSIGQIKSKMRLITEAGNELTESEAWGLVSKALRNGIYGAAEEFAKLPPEVQRIVGSPEQLRDWAQMDTDTVHSVVASNFQRSYKAIAQHRQEVAELPPEIAAVVAQIGSGPMALPKDRSADIAASDAWMDAYLTEGI